MGDFIKPIGNFVSICVLATVLMFTDIALFMSVHHMEELEQRIVLLEQQIEGITTQVVDQEFQIESLKKYPEIITNQMLESAVMQTKVIKEIDDKLVAKMEDFSNYVVETLEKIRTVIIERTN